MGRELKGPGLAVGTGMPGNGKVCLEGMELTAAVCGVVKWVAGKSHLFMASRKFVT